MKKITREKFVEICTKAILKTRENISIQNQLSGYKKYHEEIKNGYFSRSRFVMTKNEFNNGYSLTDQYTIIKQTKMGNCEELAEYLSYKIMKKLKKEDVAADVCIVKSDEIDHVYLRVQIRLEGEKESSVWEVDAWDPRIIDASLRADGTRKNAEALGYGPVREKRRFKTDKFYIKKENKNAFFYMTGPKEGSPMRDSTPEIDMLDKHEKLYSDKTVENAFKNKKLDKDGEIHFLQRKSSWQ